MKEALSTQINCMLAKSLDTPFANVQNIIRDYSYKTDAHTQAHTLIPNATGLQ